MHKERDQKFIVNTSEQFNVEVLGTEFNVSKRESGTRVVLNSGKVRLNIKEPEGNEQVIMKPGDLVEFKNGPAHYIKKAVNAKVYSSWKDKKLILDHTSLSEILTMLEENYGLKSTVADKDLLDQKVSGSMPAEEINMLLKDIAVTYRIKILKNKDTIEIRKAPEQ
jgi:ferric-dicitrate binding protein FerR (iron transport regulator)